MQSTISGLMDTISFSGSTQIGDIVHSPLDIFRESQVEIDGSPQVLDKRNSGVVCQCA